MCYKKGKSKRGAKNEGKKFLDVILAKIISYSMMVVKPTSLALKTSKAFKS
jgi:hypothetical protein